MEAKINISQCWNQFTVRLLHTREVNRLKTSLLKQTLNGTRLIRIKTIWGAGPINELFNLSRSSTTIIEMASWRSSLLCWTVSFTKHSALFSDPKLNRTALELKSTPHGLSWTSPFSGHLVNPKLSPCLRSHSPYGNSAHKHSRVFKHVWLHCIIINKSKVFALDRWEYIDVLLTFHHTQPTRSYRAHVWIRTGKVDRWLRWKGGD